MKENGYWIVATTDQGNEDWSDIPDLEVTALIVGNEGEGIKKLLLENSDYKLRIPLHGQVSSLNVVVATGICMDRLVNRG